MHPMRRGKDEPILPHFGSAQQQVGWDVHWFIGVHPAGDVQRIQRMCGTYRLVSKDSQWSLNLLPSDTDCGTLLA
jgi:hypothetical protein